MSYKETHCVEFNGTVLAIMQDPVMFELLNGQWYGALAMDEECRWYRVVRDCTDGICDWDKPSSVAIWSGDSVRVMVSNGDVFEGTRSEMEAVLAESGIACELVEDDIEPDDDVEGYQDDPLEDEMVRLLCPGVTDDELSESKQFVNYLVHLIDIYADGGAEALLECLHDDGVDTRFHLRSIFYLEQKMPGSVFGKNGAFPRLSALTADQQIEFCTLLDSGAAN